MSNLAQNLASGLDTGQSEATPQWLAELRSRGGEHFAVSGLPGRPVEEWKYTSLLALERRKPSLGIAQDKAQPAFEAKALTACQLKINMLDGGYSTVQGKLNDGVSVQDLGTVLSSAESDVSELLQSLETSDPSQGFAALNTASLNPGLVIRVAQDVDAGEMLLQWNFSEAATDALFNTRVLVILEKGARLHLLEQLENRPDDTAMLNQVIQSDLGAGSKLKHTRFQRQSANSVFVSRTAVSQAADSHYHFSGLDMGQGLARHEVRTELQSSGASCELNGACIGNASSHVDYHVEAAHMAENCESDQLFRTVGMDRSRTVFNGKVHVFKGADGTEARQSSAGLLLSKFAEIDAKPELEIYADEVIASHGATVGQLDEDAMFYMQSRGLDRQMASQVMTMAFCRVVTDRLDDSGLRDILGDQLSKALEAGLKNA